MKTTVAETNALAHTAAEAPPADPMQLIGLADRLQAAGDAPGAMALYQRWLVGSQSPLRHVVHFNLGVLLVQAQRLAEAEQSYRDAITVKPDFAQAWFNLGAVVERAGRKDHAVTIWQSMIDQPLVTPGQQ